MPPSSYKKAMERRAKREANIPVNTPIPTAPLPSSQKLRNALHETVAAFRRMVTSGRGISKFRDGRDPHAYQIPIEEWIRFKELVAHIERIL